MRRSPTSGAARRFTPLKQKTVLSAASAHPCRSVPHPPLPLAPVHFWPFSAPQCHVPLSWGCHIRPGRPPRHADGPEIETARRSVRIRPANRGRVAAGSAVVLPGDLAMSRCEPGPSRAPKLTRARGARVGAGRPRGVWVDVRRPPGDSCCVGGPHRLCGRGLPTDWLCGERSANGPPAPVVPEHPLFEAVFPCAGVARAGGRYVPPERGGRARRGDVVGLAVSVGECPAEGKPTVVTLTASGYD